MNTRNRILIFVTVIISAILIVYSIPHSLLEIENLDETYEVGESVTFLVRQEGCSVSCDGYEVEIFDEDGNTVWSVVTVIDGREPLFIPKMFQSLKDVVTIRETESVTEKPGTYTVLVTHRDLEVTQNFVVDQN